MDSLTPFYAIPRPPRAARDSWLLAEGNDGVIRVLHRWDHHEDAGGIFARSGQTYISVQNFLRSEASDTAKDRLRKLLRQKGLDHA